jgi:hypothetical protein
MACGEADLVIARANGVLIGLAAGGLDQHGNWSLQNIPSHRGAFHQRPGIRTADVASSPVDFYHHPISGALEGRTLLT